MEPDKLPEPVTQVTVTLDQLTLQTLQMGLAALQVNAALASALLTKAVDEAIKKP